MIVGYRQVSASCILMGSVICAFRIGILEFLRFDIGNGVLIRF